MIRLATNVLGVFAVKNERIIEQELFSTSATEVAAILAETVEGVCEQEEKLIKKLADSGVDELHVENPRRFWGNKLGVSFMQDENPLDPVWVASQTGVSEKDVISLISEVNRLLTLEKLKQIEEDSSLIQAVDSLDELEETINTLSERLREWYSIHFPELDHIIVKHGMYARLIAKVGQRSGFEGAKLGLDTDFANKISAAARESPGAAFAEEDVDAVRSLAEAIQSLSKTREGIESYIEDSMRDIAPNTAEIAGGFLGARLIAKAGGLKKLAFMPSSTIQVLGAEDAFFRFMKTRKKPPKHGIIFQHPDVRSAPRNTRGKIARSLAAKIAIAARTDHFKGKFVGDKLKADFEKRVKQLK